MRIRFDDFVLDTDRRELLRNDQPLHVAGKALQLLQILIENRPKAVAQRELYLREMDRASSCNWWSARRIPLCIC